MVSYNAWYPQLDIQQGEGQIVRAYRKHFFLAPTPPKYLGGWAEKCVLYFCIWGQCFQFGASLCEKNLKLIFQRQILFFGGAIFSLE